VGEDSGGGMEKSGASQKVAGTNSLDQYSWRQKILAIGIMSDEKPRSGSKPLFSDIPGKNDLDNDYF